MTASRWVLRGVRLLGGPPTDLVLDGGVIAEAGSSPTPPGAHTVDADGLIALPGLVDLILAVLFFVSYRATGKQG